MKEFKMNIPDGYTYEVTPTNYRVYYKDEFICGAGTIESSYSKKRVHYKTKLKDMKDNRISVYIAIKNDYYKRFGKTLEISY